MATAENHSARLTHMRPTTTLPIPSAVLQPQPSLLILPVTQIDNESLIPISLYAYLTWTKPQPSGGLPRIFLGQITLFPANRPGTFTIRLPQEFYDFLKQARDLEQLSPALTIELRPVHTAALPPMALTLGQVEWRRDE